MSGYIRNTVIVWCVTT